MGRISNLVVLESISEIREHIKKQTKHKNIDRLNALMFIKEERFSTREEVSQFIGVTKRTLDYWMSDYKKGGIDQMLLPEKRIRKSHIISEEINKAIGQRVNDSEQGFSSYVEAQRWISSEFGLELKYNTVREHLIRYFETKIKSPRKSHFKKDNKAVDAFLKTT